LDEFLDTLHHKLHETDKLIRYKAGGSFETTVGQIVKKKAAKNSTKHFIKGTWQRKRKIIWEHSLKGKRVLARRKWRKSHPFPVNPLKVNRLKGKTRKIAKRILGVTGKSRKIES